MFDHSSDASYWITIGHIPGWRTAKVNSIIARFHSELRIGIADFFAMPVADLKHIFLFSDTDITDFTTAKNQVPNNAFLAESLLNQGYAMIPVIAPEYPKTLKTNLKASGTPPLLYCKGSAGLLNQPSAAIVGSRAATKAGLQFTETVAGILARDRKPVVSGFAKGIDRMALDAALQSGGTSVIVLPQGITTFASGFKQIYAALMEERVCVISSFHPKAPWKVELAMARNAIIYGMANEIYVADSSEKGGTWEGVRDGLRRKRTIYVRIPQPGEISANSLLIKMGATPIDMEGRMVSQENELSAQTALTFNESVTQYSNSKGDPSIISLENKKHSGEEPLPMPQQENTFETRVLMLLTRERRAISEILDKLQLSCTQKEFLKMIAHLTNIELIQVGRKKYLQINQQSDLFSENSAT